MWSEIPDALPGLLAGPLAVAGAAKALVPSGRLAWPFERGILRSPWGPRLTGAAETTLAVALVALPAGPAAAIALAAYTALAGIAYRLRGRRCVCFGAARLASVGRVHVGANAGAAGLALIALAASGGAGGGAGGGGTAVRIGAAVASAVATVAIVLLVDRRAGGGSDAPPSEESPSVEPCDEVITGVRIYLAEGCPSCRALGRLLETVGPARRAAVTTTLVGRGAALPAPLTGMGFPCAVGTGASGAPVCDPAEGVGAVKALVDRVAVRAEPCPADAR
ncbi:hypothetical protein [Actinomadura sp. NEAU-AAG7]|uniref:hypothetical protein n=1 Tax=Actinomadura sp. NEAU-AAG7 TaxID=2839640 RepID=UPI001BE4C200|nr:hypothetical protein [Actinomadura sp. NEAU-AAG7]MBT2213839.1 hypothetical protein [Actinomadura sp. NEAU-AAG7]